MSLGDQPPGEPSRVHPLVGFSSADESARILRNYRFAVERLMRIMGGWIALTPELSAKLLLGRHVWDNAQHADVLGERLPELRSPAHVSEPANAAFAAFMSALEEPARPEQTVERLVGAYRVLKPHLIATYEQHLRRTNPIYEPPTERILSRMIADERRHVAAGETIIRHVGGAPALAERARAWQEHLEGLLRAAGGVTGTGLPAPARLAGEVAEPSLSDDAMQFVRLEQPLAHWPMPEALERALQALGDAIVARDVPGVARWLPEPARHRAPRLATLGATGHQVVAFAKVGAKRVVKLRLDAPTGAVTLMGRWAPARGGWHAETFEAIGIDLARPA